MQRWANILGLLVIMLLGLLAWREWAHGGARSELADALSGAHAEAANLESQLNKAADRLEGMSKVVEELEIERQSQGDRIANLEAQRDHLRAETDRQEERARQAETAMAEAHRHMEEVRHELLEQSRLPDQLQAQVEQAQARIAELEQTLDRGSAAATHYPETLEVAGVATDGKVVALSGHLPADSILPWPIFLCRRDRIVLEGWIHRVEGSTAIGHVGKWHDPASTLVKGQKVFILPRNNP